MLSPKGLVETPRPGLNMIQATLLLPKGRVEAPRPGLNMTQAASLLPKGPAAEPRSGLSVNQAVPHNITPVSSSLLKEEINVVSNFFSNSDGGVDNNDAPAASISKKKKKVAGSAVECLRYANKYYASQTKKQAQEIELSKKTIAATTFNPRYKHGDQPLYCF